MTDQSGMADGRVAGPIVLVVDDDPFSQGFFADMLEALGVATIHTVDNGRAALAALSNLPHTPDLLICDVFMPDMDGIEFLGKLSSDGYDGHIVLVSGQDVTMLDIAQQVALAQGLKLLGAYPKPVSMKVLVEVLGRI